MTASDSPTAAMGDSGERRPTAMQPIEDEFENPITESSFADTPQPAGSYLAGGWESKYDPDSGRVYYINQGTGERSWSLPDGATADTSATDSYQPEHAEDMGDEYADIPYPV